MTFEYTDKGTGTLSIGFAGFYDTNPRFDWNILKRFDTDVFLIKDIKMAWYLTGVDDISTDVMTTRDFIHKYIYKYDKLLFFGSSMGGYAAILYGSLVNHNNKIINAFAPQVSLDYNVEIPNQWTIKAVKERVEPYISDFDKRFISLSDADISIPKNTFIHYSKHHLCDVYQSSLIHSNRIGYDHDKHGIAVWMHENRLLMPYLTELYK